MLRGLRETGLTRRQRLSMFWSARTRLERLAALHSGDRLFKWRHYYEIYDHHFAPLRRRNVKLLEIGVGYGGSLQLWRRYFGSRAKIVGIDVRETCKRLESRNITVEIGRQDDAAFLNSVAQRHGPFDIVIDDGSHHYDHQLVTFCTLFPHIVADGLYSCEDICTSYWEHEFGGGLQAEHTYVEFLKTLVDELNAWFWRDRVESEANAFATTMHAIHFYPALAIVQKRPSAHPVVTHIGRELSMNSVG
jgi:hypothetical protein